MLGFVQRLALGIYGLRLARVLLSTSLGTAIFESIYLRYKDLLEVRYLSNGLIIRSKQDKEKKILLELS